MRFGDAEASLALASGSRLIARVPDGATGGIVRVTDAPITKASRIRWPSACKSPTTCIRWRNPAVDALGNIYVTFSGPRGQRVPVSLYKVTANYSIKPFVTSLINPTGLAVDRAGNLFVSCRHDGTIHRITPDGRCEQWVEGMGVATGIAFDKDENLYVGDRSGTIFKISPSQRNFCVCHAGAVLRGVSPGVSSQRRSVSLPGRPLRALTAYIVSTQGGEVEVFFAGLGVRRDWRSIATEIYMLRPATRDTAASCASVRREKRKWC